MRHYTLRFMPDDRVIQIHEGATLLEAAGQAGIILTTPCGGMGRCGKCRVKLSRGGKELWACRTTVQSDLEVWVPEKSRFLRQQILQHGIGRHFPLDPPVRKVFVPGRWRGIDVFCQTLTDREEVCLHLDGPTEMSVINFAEEPTNSSACRKGMTAVLFAISSEPHTQDSPKPCFRLDAVEPGDTSKKVFGAAVDIGTTTVVVNLMDLTAGTIVATSAGANPQARCGADVISRIQYAAEPSNGSELQHSIIQCLNTLIEQAAQTADIPRESIYEILAVGNTTMNHLLLNLPVAQLGQAPYRAYSLLASRKNARDLGLHIASAGQLYTVENIAGFVGSDTVAAALACGMDLPDGPPVLLVDIGTNGELVLRIGQTLWAASCAAGPALEGAGILFGSSAQDGAIQRVLLDNNNDIDIDVIGGNEARSICGSGLIDAVAILLELGIVDETGRFAEPSMILPTVAKTLTKRLVTYEGQPAFRLSASQCPNPVVLTQKDLRQFQLAKAAIRAGIRLLCQQADLPEEQLDQIRLAGAFGNYIRRESAVRAGLLPPIPVDRIRFVGNAAGAGAAMTLTSRHARELATGLAQHIEYVEIAHQTQFQETFSECLLFPENR